MSAISSSASSLPHPSQSQGRPNTPPSINVASLMSCPPTPKKGFSEVFEVQVTAVNGSVVNAAAAVFGTWRYEGR